MKKRIAQCVLVGLPTTAMLAMMIQDGTWPYLFFVIPLVAVVFWAMWNV